MWINRDPLGPEYRSLQMDVARVVRFQRKPNSPASACVINPVQETRPGEISLKAGLQNGGQRLTDAGRR